MFQYFWMWIFPWIKLSWHCWLGWVNWFWQFLCEGLTSFNLKRFYYLYARSCSLCERRTSFGQGLPLGNSADSYLCFRLALLHSMSWFFFLYQSPSSLLCTVFDSISFSIDEILLINPSANVFVFEDFNVLHKDWLSYSGWTDKPGELYYNFSFLNDLTQMFNLTTWIPDCDSHSLALLDFFLSSDTNICSTMGNSDHVVVSVYSDFPINSKQDASFHLIAYDYSCAD